MDVTVQQPNNQTAETISNARIAAFGISSQGASHLKCDPPVPCQDSHGMRWLEKEELLLAAIADGVGSCSLSHWGAYTAVSTVLDQLEEGLHSISGGQKLTLNAEDPAFRKSMKELMVNAFAAAQEAVENLADSAQPPQPVFAFQSTLTIAIYDGSCLYHGHVGDDGIVAQLPDGTVNMATRRLKGEESSSVYPLQSGKSMWSFGLVPQVAAFVMATDGVLDSFVETHPDYFGINYFDGICYSFMENAVYTLAKPSEDSAQQALAEYSSYLNSPGYRQRVTDDLTLIGVVSRESIAHAKHPCFNQEVWDTIGKESRQARRNALNHSAFVQTAAPVRMPAPQQAQPEPSAAPFIPAPPANPAPAVQKSPEPGSTSRKTLLPAAILCLILGLIIGFLAAWFFIAVPKAAENARRTEAMQQENQALNGEMDVLTDENNALTDENNALTDENNALAAENKELTDSLETLNQRIEALEQSKQALQEALDEASVPTTTADAESGEAAEAETSNDLPLLIDSPKKIPGAGRSEPADSEESTIIK